MQVESMFFFMLLVLSAAIIIRAMIKSKNFFSAFFVTAMQGVAALFAVNVLGAVTGVTIVVNYLSLAISMLGGVFGVVMVLLIKVIIGV